MKWNKVKNMLSKAAVTSFIVMASVGLTGCSMKFTGDLSPETKKEVTSSVKEEVSSLVSDINEKESLKTKESVSSATDKVKDAAEDIASKNDLSFEEASLVRVVDGDTIVVNINSQDYKVRLIGINTPESVAPKEYLEKKGTTNSEEGIKASDYTKTLLSGVDTVYLEKDVSETDRYGRLLRYVWIETPDEINTDTIAEDMVNGILLTSGAEKAAQPATYEPDTKYADEFEEIYQNY